MKNTLMVARGQRWGGGGFYKRAIPKNPYGDGTILFLECINVNILVVLLYTSITRHHHWEKLNKGYTGFLDFSLLLPTTEWNYVNLKIKV